MILESLMVTFGWLYTMTFLLPSLLDFRRTQILYQIIAFLLYTLKQSIADAHDVAMF
jgi:hypothetical protein